VQDLAPKETVVTVLAPRLVQIELQRVANNHPWIRLLYNFGERIARWGELLRQQRQLPGQ